MNSSSTSGVKSLDRAIELVNAIERLDGAGITDLAKETDIPKSTVYDHVSTLEDHEYLLKRGDTYHVGLRFLTHGALARSKLNIFQVGKDEVDSLAEETGELVSLAIEEHGLAVYVHVSRGEDAIDLDTYVGRRELLHPTAIGKAMLSRLPADKRDEIIEQHGLPQYTDHTITDRETLEAELEEVRGQGYAVDDEERVDGLRCVGATISDGDNTVVGALSVSGPVGRFDREYIEGDLAEAVRGATNVITLNMNKY